LKFEFSKVEQAFGPYGLDGIMAIRK